MGNIFAEDILWGTLYPGGLIFEMAYSMGGGLCYIHGRVIFGKGTYILGSYIRGVYSKGPYIRCTGLIFALFIFGCASLVGRRLIIRVGLYSRDLFSGEGCYILVDGLISRGAYIRWAYIWGLSFLGESCI